MKTCIIYGHDGFDVDVLRNLQAMYSQLGFRIAASRALVRADLLVIQRPPSTPLDLDAYPAVHLYDYVANDLTELLQSCVHHPGLMVFASSQVRRDQIIEKFPEVENKVRISPPPVQTRLWMSTHIKRALKYEVVHIGNHKPYYSAGSDAYASRFLHLLRSGRVHVWGAGWEELRTHKAWRGKASISDVAHIYAVSRVALGMMYPNQRDVSLSGRFWHAPLNGCHILSEPSAFADNLPGVVSYEYIVDPGEALPVNALNRTLLSTAAEAFWNDAYEALQSAASSHLDTIVFRPQRLAPAFLRAALITIVRNIRWSVA